MEKSALEEAEILFWHARNSMASTCWATSGMGHRMVKKDVQQSRSERGGDAYPEPYAELLSEARTPPGKRRVSARRDWEGETSDFFSILLEA
jgi:hypothetical protein